MSAQVLAHATAALAAAGCETPRLDAEVLLAEAVEVDRLTLLARNGTALSAAQHGRFEALIARRARREPVAYIVGRRAFRDLELAVDPRVLVPRPETELLVEAALDLPRGARVLDVGTGSGAVALALKHERPDLEVAGSDVSADALVVARANGARLGLDVAWHRADLVSGTGGPWDAVVANPPYVANAELGKLAPEITRHEPLTALEGGGDGLEIIDRLVGELAASRVPWVALEVGLGQAAVVRERLSAAGYGFTEARPDLAGIPRVVVAWRDA
jgi:release factor glutamine methyltransferase